MDDARLDALATEIMAVVSILRSLDLTPDERRRLEDRYLPPSELSVDFHAWVEARISDLQRQIDELKQR